MDALLDHHPNARTDPIEELTDREREILALMAEGRSNGGICEALWLSPKTVETHVRSIFWKLGLLPGRTGGRDRRVLAVLTYLRSAVAGLDAAA